MSIARKIFYLLLLITGISSSASTAQAQVGTPLPATYGMSDIKPGSFLFYPFYISDVNRTQTENTKISITNTHLTQTAYIHTFFIDTSTCQPADMFVCLTPNQTFSFIASEYDPGVVGYFFAVAVNKDTGLPIQFNYLIGDYNVKLASGHTANAGALAFSALKDPPATLNADGSTVDIKFDDVNYDSGPRTLAINNIPSRLDGNDTVMILTRLGGDLVNAQNYGLGGLLGLVYDDAEKGYSFTMTGGSCQLRTTITDSSPRMVPRFSLVVRPGHSGWIKIWPSGNFPIVGIVLNYNATSNANPVNYNSGHTMHALTLTNTGVFKIPVFLPTC